MTSKGFNDFKDTLGDVVSITQDFPNVRMGYAITNRDKQIISWKLPNGTSVQMYINPENLNIAESKQITHTRTKGGFVVQYWGENLIQITLDGTTGSSGVQGINVLRDIYRAEQSAFDLVAMSQMSEVYDAVAKVNTANMDLAEQLQEASQTIHENGFLLRPSLASLAVSIQMFYQGVQYKGFFTEFRVTESVERLGLFQYHLTFMATEVRGRRENFMPWHKHAASTDEMGGMIFGQLLNGIGNTLRGWVGLDEQAYEVIYYHPESAPLTFGGSGMANELGIEGFVPPEYRLAKEF